MRAKDILKMALICGMALQSHLSAEGGTARFSSFSYIGNDDYYAKRPLQSPSEFYNPILPGWYSDPSICRVDSDYYMVTSTFGYFPGIPVFHSRDLVNWEQTGNVIDRDSQMTFTGESLDKGGIYAPQITYDSASGLYYVISTDCTGIHGGRHFFVTSRNPAEGWSDPTWLDAIDGIDPSLFFDDDGSAYIAYKEDTTGQPKWSNHRAIRIIRFDPATGQTVGDPVKFNEEGVGPEERLARDEGPHIYKVNGKYYIVCAEGGTGNFHSAVCYKADNVFGPYTRWSRNPMLTQRLLKDSRSNAVTCTGHADIVQTPEGEWWAVFLGCRPCKEGYQHLGRETFMMPVHWSKDGFPYVTQEKDTVPMVLERKGTTRGGSMLSGNFTWSDDFSGKTLRPEWMSLRASAASHYKLGKKGLELTPSTELSTGKGTPAYIGRRMQHHKFTVTTTMEFIPTTDRERAGLLLLKNEGRQYFMALGKEGLTLRRIGAKGETDILATKATNPNARSLDLKVESTGTAYNFLYRLTGSGQWQILAQGIDASWLSDRAGGFTGTTIGPYAEIIESAKVKKNALLRRTDAAFFATDTARMIGEQVRLFQRVTGGWPKNIEMGIPLTEAERKQALDDKWRLDDSTTDNNATVMQMEFLARLYRQTGDTAALSSFRRGIEFLLSGQYDNGGWPQFWPENRDYQIHITYNDNAMVRTLTLVRDLMNGTEPYDADGMTTPEEHEHLAKAFRKGVECILATQIKDRDGNLTVWCQQHDRETLAPAKARAYELPSYCSSESAAILRLLMEIPDPDVRIKNAVNSGMKWLDRHKITGVRYIRNEVDSHLEADPEGSPIWARFYDLEKGEPFVCDRDGIPRRNLSEIGEERRNGYGWYNDNPAALFPLYSDWLRRNQ